MKNEKIAVVALVVIIVVSLSAYAVYEYGDEIGINLFGEEQKIIEYGDCVDVNYIGRYASNNTVFESSYEDFENKTNGTPLQIFVTSNKTEFPPEGYDSYSSFDVTLGMMEGLIGLKKGETKTIGPVPPEKAYGVSPKIGDIIDTSALGSQVTLKILDIQENATLPAELEEFKEYYGWGDITTLYVLRDESHYIGEFIDVYLDAFNNPFWEDATVVTKLNETLLWTYTTPAEDKYENLTWIEINAEEGYQIFYPENSTKIISINETSFNIKYSPEINDTIQYSDSDNPYGVEYIVENITDDKVITYLNDGSSEENRTFREFNLTSTIQRNQTQKITTSLPVEYLETFFTYLASIDSNFTFGVGPLADETLIFEVEIVEVYKTSQETS